MTERSEFLSRVRSALGRSRAGQPTAIPSDTALSLEAPDVSRRAWTVLEEASERSSELMSDLESSASTAGWKVVRAGSPEEAAAYVRSVAVDVEARTAVRSAHDVLARMDVDVALDRAGVVTYTMTLAGEDPDTERTALREVAIHAGLGVTGVDYAVAETGSVVLLARSEVSRLPALLPPTYVAIVERGKVLPSLDELFTLRRDEFYLDNLGSYLNIITGPSRTADIAQTLVTGVHGPGDVHMVLLE